MYFWSREGYDLSFEALKEVQDATSIAGKNYHLIQSNCWSNMSCEHILSAESILCCGRCARKFSSHYSFIATVQPIDYSIKSMRVLSSPEFIHSTVTILPPRGLVYEQFQAHIMPAASSTIKNQTTCTLAKFVH